MNFFRLGMLAAATSLSSCTLPTVSEPPEFQLSAKELRRQYPAKLETGPLRLYAEEIQTIRDESGRETHLASGNALLVKDSAPAILALAPRISITPEFSEVLGKCIAKKNDRLYIGQNESTKFRIEGDLIKLRGDYLVRGITPEPGKTEAPEEPAKVKPKTVKRSKPKIQERSSPAPAKSKVNPPADRASLLNLMREPTDR